ncbi:DUF4397 domain-containing protein [Mucilaginibacter sp. NFX135]|uniref:DUF4397 domain-containing protein n=1 Tax=Mucilaginibacter sp. NFX135 TaxID=3402687 RepID=UPI003AFA3A6C
MKRNFYIITCLFLIMITGCKKNTITQLSQPATGAQLKFAQAIPGLPAVDEYVNGTKISPQQNVGLTDNLKPTSVITGIAYPSAFNTAVQYGGLYPGGTSVNYALVAPGDAAIKIVTSTPVPVLVSPQTVAPNSTVVSLTQSLAERGTYSLFTIGYPDKPTALFVEDKFPTADMTKIYVRFGNFIPNGPPLDVTGVYTATGAPAATTLTPFTGIAANTLTEFLPIDANPIGTTGYTFQLYLAGTTTKVGAITKAINMAPGRYYTIMANGLYTDYVVGSTGITLKATARPTDPKDSNRLLPEIYFNPPGISYFTTK